MAATAQTLYDVPALSKKQVAELATYLCDKLDRQGYDKLGTDEQVELRLLITLLDGFAEEEPWEG